MKWGKLAEALFDVQFFLKSQKKRDHAVCDDKLYVLWKAWQEAFHGKSFNKFHGMFCTIHHFIHKYHMAGRDLEESNEAFNSLMGK